MDNMQVLAAAFERQTQILEAMAAEKGLHLKTPASTATTNGLFGIGGPFSICGLDRDVFTAHIRPTGISTALPMFPSVEEDPRYATITGVTDDIGDYPEFPCSDCQTGFMKGCNLTARFGRACKDTNTIDWDKVKLKARRGVFDDLQLHGRMLGMTDLVPTDLPEDQLLNLVTAAEMVQAAIRLERDMVRIMWQGTPAVQSAGGGWKEFPGLANQITTGQVDADTNTTCPSLDSDVKEFGYADIGGADPSIHEYLSMLEYYLYHNASRMGMLPVKWVVAMRPELWFELLQIWPCVYNTNKCGAAAVAQGSTYNLNGTEMTMASNAMQTGNYIDINGRRYDVIADDGIFEHTNINNANLQPGEYASSIFMVPLTIAGNFPVTYRQHIDYRLGGDDANLLRGNATFWTDRGMFSWALEQIKWCYKLSLKTEQRVVLRTPQLAGRIDHIKYSPLQHLRDFDPDSPYHYDGGVSVRGGGTTYAVWMSASQGR